MHGVQRSGISRGECNEKSDRWGLTTGMQVQVQYWPFQAMRLARQLEEFVIGQYENHDLFSFVAHSSYDRLA